MRKTYFAIACLTLVLVSCSKAPATQDQADSPAPAPNSTEATVPATSETESGKGVSAKLDAAVSDSSFFLPLYAGAKPIEHMAVETKVGDATSVSKGWSVTDPVEKVFEFYKTEGAKSGEVLMSGISGDGDKKSAMIAVRKGKQNCLVSVGINAETKETVLSFTQTTSK